MKSIHDRCTYKRLFNAYQKSQRQSELKSGLKIIRKMMSCYTWMAAGSQNMRIQCTNGYIILIRFFKWLYYRGIDSPKRRNELAVSERKPDCIQGIAHLKRKEITCYKPSDLWSQEDDLLFIKWVTNKRDRCYHTMKITLKSLAILVAILIEWER